MPDHPDFRAMPIEQLRVWRAATDAASAALQALGGGEVAFFVDDEGVSVTFTVFFPPKKAA